MSRRRLALAVLRHRRWYQATRWLTPAYRRALDRLDEHERRTWDRGDAPAYAGPAWMACQLCGLPDLDRGQGDGIGSCDCSRCECCGAGPLDCQCHRDFDEYDAAEYESEWGEPMPLDYLCNDPACGYRRLRATQRQRRDTQAPVAEATHG